MGSGSCQRARETLPGLESKRSTLEPADLFLSSLLCFAFGVRGKSRGKRQQRERQVRGSHSEGRRWWSGQDWRDEGRVMGSPGRLQHPVTNTH